MARSGLPAKKAWHRADSLVSAALKRRRPGTAPTLGKIDRAKIVDYLNKIVPH